MLNDVFPKINICFKTQSVFSSNLHDVTYLVTYSTQDTTSFIGKQNGRRKCSVDSISRPQLHNGLTLS